MKLNSLRPILWTEDMQGTIDFYTSVLDLECNERNDEWGWASLSSGEEVGLMVAKPNAHTPYGEIGFTGSFYFNTDDVEAMWLKVKDKVRVCYGIETFEWGMREFAVYDNNGYTLQFGQEVHHK